MYKRKVVYYNRYCTDTTLRCRLGSCSGHVSTLAKDSLSRAPLALAQKPFIFSEKNTLKTRVLCQSKYAKFSRKITENHKFSTKTYENTRK